MVSHLGTKLLEATFPGVIMSYASTAIIVTEAANEGYIAGGIATAKTYYTMDQAVVHSLELLQVLLLLCSNPVLDSVLQQMLTKIAEQAWLSLFGQGVEAWSEWEEHNSLC